MFPRMLLLALVGATTWSGCGAQEALPVHVDASITQFRFDEGTNRLRAAIVNHEHRTIRVTRARVRWAGFSWPAVEISDPNVPPGEAAAFTATMGAPNCSIRVTPAAELTARIDGHETTVPLRVEDAGLLVRLQRASCARQQLESTATITLRLGDQLQGRPGSRVLPARVVVRRTSSGEPLRLVSLGGSVLIILEPVGTPMPATTSSFSAPIEISVRERCDGHARSQSSQTFLLSAFVRLGHNPVERVVLPLTERDIARLNDLLDKECA